MLWPDLRATFTGSCRGKYFYATSLDSYSGGKNHILIATVLDKFIHPVAAVLDKWQPYCPEQLKKFKMSVGQVKIRVCLPYIPGKISSCDFIDTKTQGKSIILST